MAQDLDKGEFWLPSEFLTDDILMEKENRRGTENQSKFFFPCEFPYEFESWDSALSSPHEGSTETESDEEDYMAGLTRQMAHSTLLDDDKFSSPAFSNDNPNKVKVMAGSPQSTLCEVGSWSRYSLGSSRGSSKGQSQVSSPPSTPMDHKDDAWDVLYAAAGQVVRMKLNDEKLKFESRGLLGPPGKPVSVPVCTKEALSQLQMQHNQFQMLKQQQLMKQHQSSAIWGRQAKGAPSMPQQQYQNRARAGGVGCAAAGRSWTMSSSPWPIQHPPQPAGSGMRAVFLGGSSTKRESTGTGVFLPRRVGSPTELRKKPGCSTVLVPARVVQALNLNLDDLGSTQPRFQNRQFPDHEAILMAPRGSTQPQQKRVVRPQPPQVSTASASYEMRLPQEWTY